MEQKQRDKLLALLSDEENFDWLKDLIDLTIEEYNDKTQSGFIHTMSLAEYILRELMEDILIDPEIKAKQMIRDMLREATLKARGYPTY